VGLPAGLATQVPPVLISDGFSKNGAGRPRWQPPFGGFQSGRLPGRYCVGWHCVPYGI